MTSSNAKEHFARFQSLLALALMVVTLSLTTDSFLTVDNWLNVLRQISINLCLSIGMTMVILSGGIDLSVGSVLALSGAIAAGVLKNGFRPALHGYRPAIYGVRRDRRRHLGGLGVWLV